MNEKIVYVEVTPIILRTAKTLEEALQVQRLDTETWPDGYKHYKELFTLDSDSIFVAFDSESIVSYVGVERISKKDLGLGMPPWTHDPTTGWYKPDGNVWYITQGML